MEARYTDAGCVKLVCQTGFSMAEGGVSSRESSHVYAACMAQQGGLRVGGLGGVKGAVFLNIRSKVTEGIKPFVFCVLEKRVLSALPASRASNQFVDHT